MSKEHTHKERTTDLGMVRISNEAITAIASIAALEVRGVYKMGGGIRRTICDVFLRKSFGGGVRIQTKESEVKLTVFILVEYGVDIPRIADEVQENVKRAVEKMTGLVLSEVDVAVEGVRLPVSADKKKN
ncbi:MAG: Asp23/Gls24 family envelope stress response protein [Candidatus Omnitrophota bacterium]